MKIVIYNKNNYDRDFIEYLPNIIEKLFNKSFSRRRLQRLDKEFNINSIGIIRFSIKNIKISEQPNSYTLEIDKNKKYDHESLESLINLITYGNRSCKGYLIVYDIFKYIAENIDTLYKEWLDGS